MKKSFACSICYNGILGGRNYIDEAALTYRTNKLTVNNALRNLSLPFEKIQNITWKRIVFPIATVHMNDATHYSFIIFNKKGFGKRLSECFSKPHEQ